MSETSIQWTDHSINPIRARLRTTNGATKGGYASGVGHYCEKLSSGCANCYSSNTQPRFGMPEFPGVQKRTGLDVLQTATGDVVAVSDSTELFIDESRLKEVLRRKKPTKYFWCDMTDIFGPWVPNAWIDKCFAAMALTPHHTHQILTKRPERMADYLLQINRTRIRDLMELHCHGIYGSTRWYQLAVSIMRERWPLPNVWLGTSCENQKTADERIPHLLRCPAAVRFLSLEPLLGPIILEDYDSRLGRPYLGRDYLRLGSIPPSRLPDGAERDAIVVKARIDWIIVGGESGSGARPCSVEWIRSIIAQCKAAGVACFVKQLGANVVIPQLTGNARADQLAAKHGINLIELRVRTEDSKGGDTTEWADDLRVRQFPTIQ